MRYGLRQDAGGLHADLGMSDPVAMAALSVGVVAALAALTGAGAGAGRVFAGSAVG